MHSPPQNIIIQPFFKKVLNVPTWKVLNVIKKKKLRYQAINATSAIKELRVYWIKNI